MSGGSHMKPGQSLLYSTTVLYDSKSNNLGLVYNEQMELFTCSQMLVNKSLAADLCLANSCNNSVTTT